MAAIGFYYRRYGTTYTGTTADDTDTSHFLHDYEETKTEVEEKFERFLRKEELNIPSFKVVKKLHSTKKITNFVVNRQQNFNIRNAL